MRVTHTDTRSRRLVHMSLHQEVILRKQYVANIPGWRRPLIGYLLSIPVVGLALLATLFIQQMLDHLYFPGSLLILGVLFMALVWGVGSALLTIVWSTLVLDYFFIPPTEQFTLYAWHDILQLLPFVISGFVIAVITAQRERARLLSLAAEQELQAYAQELEVANQDLEEANQSKDRFLSMASHELKTPITTIRGQTQLVLRRLSKQEALSPEMESVRATLEKINDQTSRLTSIIDELMDISSIRAGKVKLRKKKCDIVDICRGVVEDQRLLTGRAIELDTSPISVNLMVDCDRLAQVVVNLVSNAVKYSPEGSPVQVSVNRRDHVAIIRVQDHGKGIPRDQQAHIFETFYRTPDAQSSSKPGLGLGLAISKDIVERHDGHIWCESEPGKGSTFYVELPLK